MLRIAYCFRRNQFVFESISTLMRKHNDPEDAYHFRLFDFVVLSSQVTAEHDLVRITFGSVWMMLNAYRAIIA